jgi:integrase
VNFTDRMLKALKAAPEGKNYDRWDSIVPGLGMRVAASGRRTFVLMARYPGSKAPTRRALGEYGALTLEKARQRAREWLEMLRTGKDPAIEEERKRRAEERRLENSFAAVAEDFIRDRLGKKASISKDGKEVIGRNGETVFTYSERKGAEVERDIRRVFVEKWGKRPISDIDVIEIRAIIKGFKDDGHPHQARNLLGYAHRLFGWAVDQQCYGLAASPADRLKPKEIVGKKKPRKRVLGDAELRAVWNAADDIGYPYGVLFRLLLLSGARKSELACARWSEIDTQRRVLVVPEERHKSGRGHIIWFADPAWDILEGLPRFNSGDFIFSTTFGKTPVNGFSKAKATFDKEVKKALGDEVPPWVIHDLRRTMRSKLATLPITQSVAELMIGHAQAGLVETYSPAELLSNPDYADLFAKLQEGWRLWAQKLSTIVRPPTASNVVDMAAARA